MNNSFTLRLPVLGLLVAALLATYTPTLNAQACDISYAGTPPAQISLYLSNAGVAVLDKGTVISAGYNSSCCGMTCDVQFWTDAAAMVPANPPLSTTVSFDCSDVGTTTTLYVTFWDGVDVSTKSSALPLVVSVFDNTIPSLLPPANVAVGTSVGTNANDCAANNIPAVNLALAATPPLVAGEYFDNCVTPVTYSISYPGGSGYANINNKLGNNAGIEYYPLGVSTVTYKVTDASGNFATAAFTVTVTDDQNPSITCPMNVNRVANVNSCDYKYKGADPVASASDNCNSVTISYDVLGTSYASLTGNVFPVGTTAVTATATDPVGNTTNCMFNVVITDAEKPNITSKPNLILFTSNIVVPPLGICQADTIWNHPMVTDNCGLASQTYELTGATIAGPAAFLSGDAAPNTVFNEGFTTVTYLATDIYGNTQSSSFTVEVRDNVPPAVAPAPANQMFSVSVNSTACTKLITWTRPSIGVTTDCSNPVTIHETFLSGPNPNVLNGLPAFNTATGGGTVTNDFPAGTTIIRYSWKDDSPYSGDLFVDYTFVVDEDIDPTAICQNVTLQINQEGTALLTPAAANNGSYDNCPLGLTYHLTAANGTAVAGGLAFGCEDITSSPNLYTLTVVDAANNTDQATCTVTLLDILDPNVICPSNITVSTDAGVCTKTISGDDLNLTLDGNGMLTAGEYQDNCKVTNVTISSNNGADLNSALPAAQSTRVFVGMNPPAQINGAVFQKGVTTLTYATTDANANDVVCNVTVTVLDQVAPVPTGCPAGTLNLPINTLACSHIPPAPLWNVSWTDNCAGALTVTTTGGAPNSPYPQGETTITITATDAAGNNGVCTFVVDVFDPIPPVAACKSSVSVNLSTAPTSLQAHQFNNGSTDNCTLLANSNFSLQGLGGSVQVFQNSCSNIPVTLVVTDRDGNTATCNSTVEVFDNVRPNCVAKNITRNLSNLIPGTVTVSAAEFNNGSTDNCTAPGGLVFEVSSPTGVPAGFQSSLTFDCAPLGANNITLQVRDANGNFSLNACTAVLTIVDANSPAVTGVPANTSVSCQTVTPTVAAWVNTLPDATFSDNCGVTAVVETFTVVAGTCANRYTINRKWEATDASGSKVTAQQVIQVQDNTAPVIALSDPAPILLSTTMGVCYPGGSYTPVYSDNCTPSLNIGQNNAWVINYADGFTNTGFGPTATALSGFSIGNNTITFTTNDGCGNTATKTITVTVIDDVSPEFVSYLKPSPNPLNEQYCGEAFTFNNTAGLCGYTFQWLRPWYDDVEDCNDLVFEPEDIIANGNQTISPNFPWDPTNPNTEIIPVSVSLPVGTTEFNYTITDGAGLSTTCSFTVTINDNQAPTLAGPQTATLESICPTQTVPDYRTNLTVIDNCPSNVTLTQVPAPGTLLSAVTYTTPPPNPKDGSKFVVTITAFDGTNLSMPRNITVTLNDNDDPIPTLASLPTLSSNCGFIIVQTPTAQPNCAGGALIYATPGGVVATPETVVAGNITSYRVTLIGSTCQTYNITWTYNDGNGNQAFQFQSVTVCPDVLPPVAKCKNTVVNILLAPFSATLAPATVDADNGSFSVNGSHDPDNCSPVPDTKKVTLSLNKTNFTCADLNVTSVTLTATDVAGNTASCTATIKVIDNNPPVITGTLPANITLEVCTDTIPAPPPTPAVTDNCSATVTMTQISTQTSTGSGKYNYVITRTWIATDTYGNSSTQTRTITVRDTKKPVFTAPDPNTLIFSTLPVTQDCSQLTTLNIAPLVADCAPDGELTISSSPNYFSLTDQTEVLPVGSHVVVFTATDPSGNSATLSVTIVVRDATPPTAVCINGISVALNPNGQAIVTPNLVNNNSSDNCTNPVILRIQQLKTPNGDTLGNPANQLFFDCEEADGDTQYPLILIARDAAGNATICETYVVIQDNVKPTIQCPANTNVACSTTPATAFAPSVLGNAVANDNCPITASNLTFTDAPVNNGFTCGSFIRTFKVTDVSGNTATCNQTVTVTDNQNPVFTTLPQSATLNCGDPLVSAPIVGAVDNCTPANEISVVLAEVKTAANNTCGTYQFTVTRTWTATDKCGNTAKHTQVLTVKDTKDPEFVGLPDTIKVSSASFPPNTNCTVPVSFNLADYVSDCQPDSVLLVTNDAPEGDNGFSISGAYQVGNYKVRFSVIDACGNSAVDSLWVIVVDNSIPTAVCNDNVVIALGTNGEALIEPSDINLASIDNCGIDTMWLTKTLFDCGDLGTNAIQLFVRDASGNTNSCDVNVNVTLGSTVGFTLQATSTNETAPGASNGTATATITGGTGVFAFVWSNSATTPTLSGLAPGDYTITVTDLGTGCVSSQTVTVEPGPDVEFSAGAASGCQNGQVSIPVTVNNLSNANGFTFSMAFTNNAVGEILGITGANPLLPGLAHNVNGNKLGIFWATTGAPISLPAGTVVFNVLVKLSLAPVGTTTSFNFGNDPVPFDVAVLVNGVDVNLTIDDVSINNGAVTINCLSNDVDITGKIETWRAPVKPVPGANVALTGATMANTLTAANGTYGFSVLLNNNSTLTPTKVTAGNDGITGGDLLLIQGHIFGSLLTSPYAWVAADVNNDKKITLNDYLRIQKVVLGTDTHIQGSPDWKFVRKPYNFPTPDPLVAPYPQDSTFVADADKVVDFVGVRMGDVNGNITPSLTNDNSEDRTDATLYLQVEDISPKVGEVIAVPVRAADFKQWQGYQLTLGFDAEALELEEIEMGTLPGLGSENFGTAHLADGYLTHVWVSSKPVSLPEDAILFTLHFRSLRSGKYLSELLHAGSEITRAEAYRSDAAPGRVDMEFGRMGDQNPVAPFALYQNQPNPFADLTKVSFSLPQSGRGILRVYSTTGQLVKTVVGSFEKGYNEVNFRKDELGQPGVYWYELETASHSDRKKMILMD